MFFFVSPRALSADRPRAAAPTTAVPGTFDLLWPKI